MLELGGKVNLLIPCVQRHRADLLSLTQDPAVILPSADVKFFMNTWMRAVLCVLFRSISQSQSDVLILCQVLHSQAASQNCIGAERFLVHSSLYDSFVSEATTRIKDLKLGDVLSPNANDRQIDVGAMVTDRLFDTLESLIEDAVKNGARCLVGGKRASPDLVGAGHYFQPTLLVDV